MATKKSSSSSNKFTTKSTNKTVSNGSRSSGTSLAVREPSSLKLAEKQQKKSTRIIIKYDVGFNNNLYLRGSAANLNWEKGIRLKNLKSDEWVFETDQNFTNLEFKVLINDQTFEVGPNHSIKSGTSLQYTPRFH